MPADRTELRSRLTDGIEQAQGVLDMYSQAYPDLTQTDPVAVQQALAAKPVPGVNVHAEPQGLRPAWLQEETIEPLALGDTADPVSQLAFLAAPGALSSIKSALKTVADPLPGVVGGFRVPRVLLRNLTSYERDTLEPVSVQPPPLPGQAGGIRP